MLVGQDIHVPGELIFTREYEDPTGQESHAPFSENFSPTAHSLN